jgi:hypothetical protein
LIVQEKITTTSEVFVEVTPLLEDVIVKKLVVVSP